MAISPSSAGAGRTSASNAVAGAAGGVVSVLLGQPFVRLQTSNSSNVFRIVSDIFKNEGPLAFYKGALLPFVGVGAAVSIQFSVFHAARQALERLKIKDSLTPEQRLSNFDHYLAGGAAGVANSIISGPVEHVRIRLQMQPSDTRRLYSGPSDCISKISAKAGIQGLFKGQGVAVLREFQAYGCYFVAFEASMKKMAEVGGKTREGLSTWEIAPCGALAGIAFWVGSYPLDVVKTKLQNDGFGPDRRYKNAWAVAAQTWKTGRFPAFWRGLGPTLLRTVLSSSGTFVV
ncbi:hypothetical protein H2200_006400 [Cladophialophora chaetospira]|uniref:Mitochondrial thiamine pyrophosphate carrier 1 n=1 Tax=Cladophialophora chaetospira TaxID=386627 RepID=A0AA38X8B0_9EURO|nr:hypothetical protein H2200_006400 [Cladophialophora chaetospira]